VEMRRSREMLKMSDEKKQLIDFLIRCMVLIVFCALYAIGGSGDFWGGQLWIRRWLAPFIICAFGAVITRGDWRSYAFYPFMAGALCLPYGADVLWLKICLRALFGLTAGLTFNSYNFLTHRVSLFIFGVLIAILGSIILGVWNPVPNAIIEQGLIALCISLTYVFSVRGKL
jgi:hypothetical protein